MTEIIELKNVSLAASVGSSYLLKDISFSIEKGERLVIIGPSGAGKTSLLRLFNRLATPTHGSIYLEKQELSQIPVIKLRQQVVLVPQEPKLLGMTVAEALAYPLHLQNYSKSEIKQRIIDGTNRLHIPQTWLERTELQLSLGQRQLVGITRGLIMEPKILVLDEPTSALDTGLSEHLLTVLNILKTTIVMVNHQLDIAKKLAQRILYLEEGQLLQDSLAHQIDWGLLREKLVTAQANFTEEWL